MAADSRQTAFNYLICLAEKRGYVIFDEIIDCADKYSLSIQDFDWLSNAITTRGVMIYNDTPTNNTLLPEEDDYYDFAQSDYTDIYKQIIDLSPTLEPFVSYISAVKPPQRGEIRQLTYQIVDGNAYARTRMIEMHLRLALRIALQRAVTYDMEIEDAVGYACIGLITAVDKYDPDVSGPFAPYAALWIIQNISREQSTQRQLIYYPVHRREGYFSIYPIIKLRGCLGCERLNHCTEAMQIVQNNVDCTNEDAQIILEQMVPDEHLEELYELYATDDKEIHTGSSFIDVALENFSNEAIVTEEDAFVDIRNMLLHEEVGNALAVLKPKEETVVRLRYGFEGQVHTLEEVGAVLNVTRERVRQIEEKALRKLRSERLKDLWL